MNHFIPRRAIVLVTLASVYIVGVGVLLPACGSSPSSPSASSPNYAGVWTGLYDVVDCRNLDVPGLIPLALCPFRTQSYQFTLTQTGTLVTGTYKLGAFYNCACEVLGYGEFEMTG